MLRNRRVLLAQPHVEGGTQATPDLGLGFLATALRRAGFDVAFLDGTRVRMTEDDFLAHVEREDFAVVGLKVFSMDLLTTQRLIRRIKHARPGTLVLVGGPHPSCSPDDVLDSFPEADYAFRGEAETGLPALLEALTGGAPRADVLAGIPGLIYRTDSGVHANPQQCVADLDTLGMPAWDLMDPRTYQRFENLWIFQKRAVVAPLHITRGCPYQCTFCSGHTVTGRSVRFRSLENVVAEMRTLYDTYEVREFQIIDDWFTRDREYVLGFCEALRRARLDVAWCCPYGIRLDSVDADLLHAMEDACCYGVSVGIESGSQRILDFVKKRLRVEEVREQLDLIARETHWLVQGFFIIGFPTETRDEIQATVDFACSLPIHLAAFTPFRAAKGTELYDYLVARGEISGADWSAMTVNAIRYAPEGITLEELARIRRTAYLRFYSNPRRALKLLAQLRYPRQMRVFLSVVRRRLFG